MEVSHTNGASNSPPPQAVQEDIQISYDNDSRHDAHNTQPSVANGKAGLQEDEQDGYNSYGMSAGEAASTSAHEPEPGTIQAYAKLQFLDGDFYMTTYATELGRSMDGQPQYSPGMHELQTIREVRDMANSLGLDPRCPSDCPLIPISRNQMNSLLPVTKKGISRRHIRIQFNFEQHYFEILFLGRNGGFLDDEWIAPGDIQPLVNGSHIQIGNAGLKFWLPDVPEGETGAELLENEEPFEESDGGSVSEELGENEDEREDAVNSDEDAGTMATHGGGKIKAEVDTEPRKPRRKGPGRPPKNGIMSKREEAELAKRAKEDSKNLPRKIGKTKNGRGRGKTAKAKELEKSSTQPSGKRKYTKRKKTMPETEERKEADSTEHTDSSSPEQASSKPSKEQRAAKQSRSPSPVFNEDELTAEQLARPPHSYVVLIHEALTNHATGEMILPQIYRAIERKYPYFKLRCTTQGWQSSVRHNLGQHAAFKKIHKKGKGWLWGLDHDVSIEKEKKRRTTPPPQSQPRYYPQPQTQQHQQGTYAHPAQHPYGQMPPNARMPTNPYPPINTYHMHNGIPHASLPPRAPFAAPMYPLMLTPQPDTYQSPYDTNSNGQGPQPNQPNTQMHTSRDQHEQPRAEATPGAHQTHNDQRSLSYGFVAPPQGLSDGPDSVPQGGERNTQRLSPTESAALNRFKSYYLENIVNRAHAERIIESAVSRTLDPSKPSEFTSDQDLHDERVLMKSAETVIAKVRNDENNAKSASPLQGQSGNVRAAQLVEDTVKSMPRPTASQPQNGMEVTNGMNGTGHENGHGHKRTATADESDQPGGKKRNT